MYVPSIGREENGEYKLEDFTLPPEYEAWKTMLSEGTEESRVRFAKFAKIIFEAHNGPSKFGFPRLEWNKNGELERVVLGTNCACAQLATTGKSYVFHNIDLAGQAMAAYQILAKYINALKAQS